MIKKEVSNSRFYPAFSYWHLLWVLSDKYHSLYPLSFCPHSSLTDKESYNFGYIHIYLITAYSSCDFKRKMSKSKHSQM